MSTVTTPQTVTVGKVAATTARILGQVMISLVQYTMFIPFLLLPVRLIRPAFKLGLIGLLLFLVPVLGWIVLAVLVFRRRPADADGVVFRRGDLAPWRII